MAKKNIFSGADDIYLTDNKIAVRRISSKKTRNGFETVDKTVYVAKTQENLRVAKSIFGNIRKGRK